MCFLPKSANKFTIDKFPWRTETNCVFIEITRVVWYGTKTPEFYSIYLKKPLVARIRARNSQSALEGSLWAYCGHFIHLAKPFH